MALLDGVTRRYRERRDRLWSAAASRLLRFLVGRRVHVPEPATTHDPRDLERRTDELNRAAESYFVEQEDPEFLIHKPFSSAAEFGKYLFNLGLLVEKARIAPGQTVLDLGAGAGWVSHFLNRFGCRTISVDVSRSALDLAEETFRRDPATRWDLEPRFLLFDGHRLPLGDACCDRVVVHDAFHHVPNQRQVLAELGRVLVQGGIVALNEPGRRHSESAHSRREMELYGVLENDVVVEDLAELAAEAGFTETTVVPVNLRGAAEIPARDLVHLVRGEGLADWWREMAPHLLNEHFIFLHKGAYVPDTRSPGTVRAEIEPAPDREGEALNVTRGEPALFPCRVRNAGNTRWLPEEGLPGGTQLGVYTIPPDGGRVRRDWLRVPLTARVEPGEDAVFQVELPPFDEPGERLLEFDLVAEDVAWFRELGSEAVRLRVVVS